MTTGTLETVVRPDRRSVPRDLVSGFRGAAVLLLVASQAWLLQKVDLDAWKPLDAFFASGNVAVSMLLAATGFTVTRSLLDARHEAGTRGVLASAVNRAWRVSILVILVLLTVLVVAGLDGTDPTTGDVTRSSVVSAGSFQLNHLIATSPLAVRADITNLWYVSVEMQLVLALTAVVVVLGGRLRVLGAALAAVAVLGAWWGHVVLVDLGWFVAAMRTDVRGLPLTAGAVAAVLVRGRTAVSGRAEAVVGGAALLLAGIVVSTSRYGIDAYFGLQGALAALACALFLGGSALVTAGDTLAVRALVSDGLVTAGRSWLSVVVWTGPVFSTVARQARDSEPFSRVLVGLLLLALVVYLTDRVIAPALTAGWRAVRLRAPAWR